MVELNWTPEEEEAWCEIERRCPSPAQTLASAKQVNVGYVYLCKFCDDYHVTELASEVRSVLRP